MAYPRGDEHYQGKLNTDKVIDILSSDESNSALAARHGVSPVMVWKVRHRKAWRHVSVPDRHS